MTLPLEDKEKNMTTRIFCLKNNSPYMLINERSLICPISKSSGFESSHIYKQSSEHKIVHTQTNNFFKKFSEIQFLIFGAKNIISNPPWHTEYACKLTS